MLNYIKADLYRASSRVSSWIWVAILLILPPLLIIGAGTQYEASKIVSVIPAAIYIMFIVVALLLSESIFGEDKRLGLYKNDTTSGISRTRLFISKFLSSAIIEIGLWILCSLVCSLALAKVMGFSKIGESLSTLFSLQSVLWLLLSIFYAAMFQTIRVFVNKTGMLILIYSAISTLFTQVTNLLQKVFPTLSILTQAGNIADLNVFQTVLIFIIPLAGITGVLFVGSILFKRSEF